MYSGLILLYKNECFSDKLYVLTTLFTRGSCLDHPVGGPYNVSITVLGFKIRSSFVLVSQLSLIAIETRLSISYASLFYSSEYCATIPPHLQSRFTYNPASPTIPLSFTSRYKCLNIEIKRRKPIPFRILVVIFISLLVVLMVDDSIIQIMGRWYNNAYLYYLQICDEGIRAQLPPELLLHGIGIRRV